MHPHMVCSIEEAAELTSIPEKLTVIYPTSSGPIECLLWSTFSLLLRTKVKDYMEHFIVCINGPDKRTGDVTIGDTKQAFLEDLRKLKWYHVDSPKAKRDMPITVIRVWSRIGHPEAVEMAIPWVHTDSYLIMHDDLIICQNDWMRVVEKTFFNDPNVIIAYAENNPITLLCAKCDSTTHIDKPLLRFPHLLCLFLCCRKKYMSEMGSSWCGYHINTPPFKLHERVGDVNKFFQYYKDLGALGYDVPQLEKSYDFISMEMGAWHYYNAVQKGYHFAPMPLDIIHFGAMSWEIDTGKQRKIMKYQPQIKALEKEIYAHPDYGPLYDKYLPSKYKT